MVTELQKTISIKGLRDIVDPRQVAEPYVVDGKNFIMTATGPSTSFGGVLVSPVQLPEFIGVETFAVNNELLLFTRSAILKFDVTSGRFYPVYAFTALTQVWRWSMAIVGGVYYFAYLGADLISYNPLTDTWATTTTDIPSGLRYVAEAAGRLIVLGDVVVGWSAIDTGTDLATSTATGAGQQVLSLAGSGVGLAVLPVAGGYIIYTKTGLIKGESIDAVAPFRHYQLNALSPALDVFSVTSIVPDTHIFLSDTGLYSTTGKTPAVWQPVMSEYITNKVLPVVDLTGTNPIRLTFLDDLQQVFISFATTTSPNYYTRAFVLYLPSNEWGSFDRTHAFVGLTDFTKTPDAEYLFGWISDVGDLYKFVEPEYVETPVVEVSGNYIYRPGVEIPTTTVSTVAQAATLAVSSAVDESIYGANINYFTTTDFVTWSLLGKTLGTIDSFVSVGTYHLTDNQFEDSVVNVTDLVVGIGPVTTLGDEDWLTSTEPDTDWAVGSADADWGFGVTSSMEFVVKMEGTLDGKNKWLAELETLAENYRTNQFRRYPVNTNGIYNIVHVLAQGAFESFHLKSLAVSGNITGRL